MNAHSSAFPQVYNPDIHGKINPHYSKRDIQNRIEGLTKREYFAAMAMQGMLSSAYSSSGVDIVIVSVKMADRMIEELNKS